MLQAVRGPARRSGRPPDRQAACSTSAAAPAARRSPSRGCSARTAAAVGIDISEPMIAAARARAEREGTPARFIRADAQTHAFEPASFDMIISRFGVMFFDDSVRAFANLRRAASDGAEAPVRRLAERCGESVHDDGRARRGAVPAEPPRPPAGRAWPVRVRGPAPRVPHPGGERLGRHRHPADRRGLHASPSRSWSGISPGSVRSAWSFPRRTRRLARGSIEAVRPAFDPYVHGAEVRFNAACWMVGARGLST